MATLQPQEPPAFFVRGPSPFARLIFFSVLSLVLMAVDARLHYLAEVRQGFSTLMHPLEVLASSPLQLYGKLSERMASVGTLTAENRNLREQVMRQSVDLQQMPSLQGENKHLRQLLDVRQTLQKPAQVAEIVRAGRDPFVQRIIVNAGSQQGVVPGQAVVDGQGVIGQVTRAFPFSSEITLITDRELAIPVQVERNGMRAIAFGHGRENMLDLPYLPANVDIQIGDRLVTSGIDGTYPAGLAVATVSQVERTVDSHFAHILCTPVAGTDRRRQVLILTPNAPEVPLPDEGSAPDSSEKHRAHRHAIR